MIGRRFKGREKGGEVMSPKKRRTNRYIKGEVSVKTEGNIEREKSEREANRNFKGEEWTERGISKGESTRKEKGDSERRGR